MRINIEASAEELAKLKDLGFLVEEFTDVICDLLDRDLPVPLPSYTVTLNEPSVIQAQLVAALGKIYKNECEVFDEESNGMVICCMDTDDMMEVARTALAAAGAQP